MKWFPAIARRRRRPLRKHVLVEDDQTRFENEEAEMDFNRNGGSKRLLIYLW